MNCMKGKTETSPFITLTTKKIESGRFHIIQDRVRVNDHEQNYDYIDIKGGVSILALVGEEVLLQRQYRYPIRSWQWELPGGFIDEGETPAQAAVRELQEETGFGVKEIRSLGSFFPSFGSTNEEIHLFLAICEETAGEADREPGEVITLIRTPLEKWKQMIAEGDFCHGAGLAAWARFSSRDSIHGCGSRSPN